MLYKILIILLLLPVFSKADEQAVAADFLDLVRETISQARYCALITLDADGQPRARTVDPFAPEDDFTVWIATRPVTRKVEQIAEHDQVTLYYWHAETSSYVTIMGSAELVRDEKVKLEKRRDIDSERFYPDFPDDYLLIGVTPSWLEAMVPGHRGDPLTWKPEVVRF